MRRPSPRKGDGGRPDPFGQKTTGRPCDGPFCFDLTGFADEVELREPIFALGQKLMSGFGAEMRHIHDGGRIIGQHAQDLSRGHGFQTLARFQDGQGAQEPRGVEGVIGFCHDAEIAQIPGDRNGLLSAGRALFQRSHKDVTRRQVTPRVKSHRWRSCSESKSI